MGSGFSYTRLFLNRTVVKSNNTIHNDVNTNFIESQFLI